MEDEGSIFFFSSAEGGKMNPQPLSRSYPLPLHLTTSPNSDLPFTTQTLFGIRALPLSPNLPDCPSSSLARTSFIRRWASDVRERKEGEISGPFTKVRGEWVGWSGNGKGDLTDLGLGLVGTRSRSRLLASSFVGWVRREVVWRSRRSFACHLANTLVRMTKEERIWTRDGLILGFVEAWRRLKGSSPRERWW
ncbi:hypothetical protein IE53DRAFT_92478 [Violaceomyces palustris]|uniref:Uncharacterized protein n=1 Tax=Violaceomyces palustris TaxID=1673888 RepID=A0ACD0NXI9_9BASI|nr:hypothetical protein IE53DRAFT_92478 [Violaceomyces palustris]